LSVALPEVLPDLPPFRLHLLKIDGGDADSLRLSRSPWKLVVAVAV
jgi:hypothetical protein